MYPSRSAEHNWLPLQAVPTAALHTSHQHTIDAKERRNACGTGPIQVHLHVNLLPELKDLEQTLATCQAQLHKAQSLSTPPVSSPPAPASSANPATQPDAQSHCGHQPLVHNNAADGAPRADIHDGAALLLGPAIPADVSKHHPRIPSESTGAVETADASTASTTALSLHQLEQQQQNSPAGDVPGVEQHHQDTDRNQTQELTELKHRLQLAEHAVSRSAVRIAELQQQLQTAMSQLANAQDSQSCQSKLQHHAPTKVRPADHILLHGTNTPAPSPLVVPATPTRQCHTDHQQHNDSNDAPQYLHHHLALPVVPSPRSACIAKLQDECDVLAAQVAALKSYGRSASAVERDNRNLSTFMVELKQLDSLTSDMAQAAEEAVAGVHNGSSQDNGSSSDFQLAGGKAESIVLTAACTAEEQFSRSTTEAPVCDEQAGVCLVSRLAHNSSWHNHQHSHVEQPGSTVTESHHLPSAHMAPACSSQQQQPSTSSHSDDTLQGSTWSDANTAQVAAPSQDVAAQTPDKQHAAVAAAGALTDHEVLPVQQQLANALERIQLLEKEVADAQQQHNKMQAFAQQQEEKLQVSHEIIQRLQGLTTTLSGMR